MLALFTEVTVAALGECGYPHNHPLMIALRQELR
jgi:hypothetical protein